MATIARHFEDLYGRKPEVIAEAPGRVNLIGEHIDYSEGFVLPFAIADRTYAAIAAETGMPIRELNAAVRGVTAELRGAIRAELVREGVEDESLEAELARMEEALRP